MRAFISHASQNDDMAQHVARALRADGLDVWLDVSNIRAGGLLGPGLQHSILDSDALVLLWSTSAAASEWVNTEWLMAVHEGKPVIPCLLDASQPPQCMEAVVQVDLCREFESRMAEIARSIPAVEGRPMPLTPAMVSTQPGSTAIIERVKTAQSLVLQALMSRDLQAARERFDRSEAMLEEAQAAWPWNPMIRYNLQGYHLKNAYVLKHWHRIHGGQAPAKDPLLLDARWSFIHWLWVDPLDPYALNGLGNLFFYARELPAAESFTAWALSAAEEKNVPANVVAAFHHDRRTTHHFCRRAEAATARQGRGAA